MHMIYVLTGSLRICRWDGDFIRFLDGLLQVAGFSKIPETYQLRLPVEIRQVDILLPSPALKPGRPGIFEHKNLLCRSNQDLSGQEPKLVGIIGSRG